MKRNTIVWIGLFVMAASVALAADNDAAKTSLAQLQGEWTLVSGTNDGTAMSAEMLKSAKRICHGDDFTLMNGAQVVMKAKMTIDPSKKPKRVDYQINEGPAKGKHRLGIYEVTADTLKTCSGAPDGPRPTEFVSRAGEGCTLTVWTRVKK